MATVYRCKQCLQDVDANILAEFGGEQFHLTFRVQPSPTVCGPVVPVELADVPAHGPPVAAVFAPSPIRAQGPSIEPPGLPLGVRAARSFRETVYFIGQCGTYRYSYSGEDNIGSRQGEREGHTVAVTWFYDDGQLPIGARVKLANDVDPTAIINRVFAQMGKPDQLSDPRRLSSYEITDAQQVQGGGKSRAEAARVVADTLEQLDAERPADEKRWTDEEREEIASAIKAGRG